MKTVITLRVTTYDDQNKVFSTEKTSYVKYGDTYYTKEEYNL